MNQPMDETTFEAAARQELSILEDAFESVDPDEVEISSSEGVLRLDTKDGTRIVINSHRAARQIWMAAVASAWHFDKAPEGHWTDKKSGSELRQTIQQLVKDHSGATLKFP